MKDIYFDSKKTLNVGGQLLSLDKPVVMGILNATPDSFYAPSRVQFSDVLLKSASNMIAQGAAILDIGGCSTRPEAAEVSEEEEMYRVLDVVALLHSHFPKTPISIDTYRVAVARAAVKKGAAIVNDISGGTLDETMFATVASLQVPYILTHTRGTPQTMAGLTDYEDLIKEMVDYFEKRIYQLQRLGAKDIIIDLGFGFAKTIAQNFELMKHLSVFHIFKLPMLIGISRKSMVYKTLNCTPQDALNGTTVLHTAALLKGASILRVHDVGAAREAILLCEKIKF